MGKRGGREESRWEGRGIWEVVLLMGGWERSLCSGGAYCIGVGDENRLRELGDRRKEERVGDGR